MRKVDRYLFRFVIVLLLMIIGTAASHADDDDILNRKITLKKNKGTVYELLQQISENSGYLFIYDSQIINNNKKVKLPKNELTIKDAIYDITGSNTLRIKVVNKHILLYKQENKTPDIVQEEEKDEIPQKNITVKGQVFSSIDNEPLPAAAISVVNSTIGTIANQDGSFQLILPDSLKNHNIRLSSLGYQNQEVEASYLTDQNVTFYLSPQTILLQEIVVKVVDPLESLKLLLLNRRKNYETNPSHITAFYREGIDHKKNNINITEAVLDIYKSRVEQNYNFDQVKIIKMRRIIDKQENDTLFPKLKSGVKSCLILDVIKGDLIDFLNPTHNTQLYNFKHIDVTTIDNRRVDVISFEPKNAEAAFLKGEIYIDSENHSLVKTKFEFYKKSMDKAANMFILKRNKYFELKPQNISYSISYREIDGKYYINHVRGDLHFKVKRKKKLFSSPLHLWFEMVTCQIETNNTKPFKKGEVIETQDVFADKSFEYDQNFWGDFNVITQEEQLREAIIRMIKYNQLTNLSK